MMIQEAIQKAVEREDLSEAEVRAVMEEVLGGRATEAQIGAFMAAMRMKGETVEEITAAARALKAKAESFPFRTAIEDGHQDVILDTCGTGGDGSFSFNVSTAVAFVLAGGGIKVAKHGNRSVSSRCGSADVLEAMGVRLDLPAPTTAFCLKELGVAFFYAPQWHRAMKHAARPRREVRIRSFFNLLGPLSNPASPNVQLMGVCRRELTTFMAEALKRLGCRSAFVVCGEGPIDEISITGATRVARLYEGRIETFQFRPEDFGMKRAEMNEIKGGDAIENAAIIKAILSGEKGARRDMVILNSAAAFVACGRGKTMEEGIGLAEESIDSGKALSKLRGLISLSKRRGEKSNVSC